MKLIAPSGVSVVLPDNVHSELFTLSKKSFPLETGGIIYGSYTDNNRCASIAGITAQTSDSRAGRTWFHRGVNRLQKFLNNLWSTKLYYLGEWHFHPSGAPHPSGRDLSSLKSIAASSKTNCSDPLMLIIGGTTSALTFRLFLVNADGDYVELSSTEQQGTSFTSS
ncbi:MAG TPA: Mov34/MPN/PAD-1 family protein [Planktothrix sp.]|jgi:integrative and conjugative element protein (TIGR02256 family)